MTTLSMSVSISASIVGSDDDTHEMNKGGENSYS